MTAGPGPTSAGAVRGVSLRATLGAAIVGLLLLVVGGAVGVWSTLRARSRDAVARTLVDELARGVEREVAARVADAEAALATLADDVAAGRLGPADADVGPRLVAWLRRERRLDGVALAGVGGAAAEAARQPDGTVLVRRDRPAADGAPAAATLERRGRDGAVAGPPPPPAAADAGAAASAWCLRAGAPDGGGWTAPHRRRVDGAVCRACARAVEGPGGDRVVAAVTATPGAVAPMLAEAWRGRGGVVAMVDPASGRAGVTSAPVEGALAAALAEVGRGVGRAEAGAGTRVGAIEVAGEAYVTGTRRLAAGAGGFAVVALAPEAELLAGLDALRAAGLVGAGVVLLGGIASALLLAARVARPLRRLSGDLAQVAAFRLEEGPPLTSRIVEVAAVADAAARMRASLRSFARYVPTDLVRDLVARGGEARLGGELRRLTLFFSDVEGFTTAAEGRPPADVVAALGDYLERVTAAITGCGGTVDKFVGDGVVAFFNAPAEQPDHAAAACRAALRLQAELAAAGPAWVAAGRPAFRTRIGLHTDEVVVGNLGTPDRFGYTVLGDGANLAARLEGLNKAYGTSVLGSAATRDAAGPGFAWRRVDRVAVVGRAGGGDVFELLGEALAVDAARLAARDVYDAAFEAYLARRFAEAEAGFREAERRRPGDRAAATLAARCAALVRDPPPASWTGVHVSTTK